MADQLEEAPAAPVKKQPKQKKAAQPVAAPVEPAPAAAVPELQEEEEEESTPAAAPPPAPTPDAAAAKLFTVDAHHDTEEVLERLLDVTAVSQSVSGLWGWMQGGAAKVAEAAQEAKLVAQVKAAELQDAALLAKDQASARAEALLEAATTAAATATTTTETSTTKNVLTSLPWDALPAERRAEAKERVLKLSMDDNTFTVPPPTSQQHKRDEDEDAVAAHRLLEVDAMLGAKRFKLVPKTVSEPDFWRNYLYRVHLIVSALGGNVPAVPAVPAVVVDDEKKDEAALAAKQEPDVDSSGGDNFDMLDDDDDLEFDDDDDEDLAKELQ